MTGSSLSVEGIPLAERKKALPRRGGEKVNPLKAITQRNQQRVFEEIVITRDPAAKDLNEITGLAPSTVAGIVRLLSDRHLIRIEKPGRGSRGRQPSPLRVNREAHYIAGVEILPDEVHGLVTNLCGESVTPLRRVPLGTTPARQPVDSDRVVDSVRQLVEELAAELVRLKRGGMDADRPLLGLGVEIGGHVDGYTGTVVFSPNLRWGGEWTAPVPLRQRLRDATRLPTVVDNDVNALAIAQRWFGEGRKTESYAVVYIAEDGIGGALFYQGEIVRGAMGKVAEFGHQIVASRPVDCRCGGRGCLEAVATPDKMVQAMKETTTLDQLQERLAAGDAAAREAFTEGGQAMGRAVANLIVLADPGTVIFTGSGRVIRPSEAHRHRDVVLNDTFHAAMCEVVEGHPWSAGAVGAFAVLPDEGDWNGPRGAASLVIRDVVARAVQDPSTKRAR